MKLALLDYFDFLKRPRLLKLSNDKQLLWRDFYSLIIFCVTFSALMIGVYYILLSLRLIKSYENTDFFKEFGVSFTFFLGVIVAPVFEELFFRWHLRKRYASIYFVLLSVAAIANSTIESLRINWVVFVGCLGLAVSLHYILKAKSRTLTEQLWQRGFRFLFYYTGAVFGYIHIGNIKGLTVVDPSFILYIAPQMMGGMALGYLRIKYGLTYSTLFHACYNLIVFSLLLLFS